MRWIPASYFRNIPTERKLQVFSGCIPFHHITNDPQIMSRIIAGRRPPRPILSEPSRKACKDLGLNDHMWSLIEDCWKPQPGQRPTASKALERLPGRMKQMDTPDEPNPSFAVTASENIVAWAISRPRHDTTLNFPQSYETLRQGIMITSNLKSFP
jgi:hypothetical protein